jgi:hypothetical protein
MTSTAAALRATLLSSALLASPAAWACGYHDPASLNRGILNWVYPNALYVTSAVWRAQLDGLLSRDDRPDATKALLGYGVAVKQLGQFRDDLSLVRGGHDEPAISMVLLGPMLWTRFAPTETGLDMTPDAAGPAIDDVVIVTDEPVLKALVEGKVTPETAREMGLIRLYGTSERVQRVASWLNRLSQPADRETAKASG